MADLPIKVYQLRDFPIFWASLSVSDAGEPPLFEAIERMKGFQVTSIREQVTAQLGATQPEEEESL